MRTGGRQPSRARAAASAASAPRVSCPCRCQQPCRPPWRAAAGKEGGSGAPPALARRSNRRVCRNMPRRCCGSRRREQRCERTNAAVRPRARVAAQSSVLVATLAPVRCTFGGGGAAIGSEPRRARRAARLRARVRGTQAHARTRRSTSRQPPRRRTRRHARRCRTKIAHVFESQHAHTHLQAHTPPTRPQPCATAAAASAPPSSGGVFTSALQRAVLLSACHANVRMRPMLPAQ
jgi:hypothetical protein